MNNHAVLRETNVTLTQRCTEGTLGVHVTAEFCPPKRSHPRARSVGLVSARGGSDNCLRSDGLRKYTHRIILSVKGLGRQTLGYGVGQISFDFLYDARVIAEEEMPPKGDSIIVFEGF